MPEKVFSTHTIAGLCNVHHTTVINWVKEGMLKAYRTPGGHRRVKKSDLIKFLKKFKMPVPSELQKESKYILIVDDDHEALEELKEALGGKYFEIGLAHDAFEAGRKIYKKKPDLILLDFKMPGMDGFQVCNILWSDKETKNIPVFAITVLTSDEDIKRIKSCDNIKAYFPKPVELDRLLKSIKKILGVPEKNEKE